MTPESQMQAIITAIAAKHDIDLYTVPVGSALRLDMPGYDRLCIEKIGPCAVSVAHYFEQHGDLIADPEIVFYIGTHATLPWIPTDITQVLGYRQVAELSFDGRQLRACSMAGVHEVAEFAETWAGEIRAYGWLEDGTLTYRKIAVAERAA